MTCVIRERSSRRNRPARTLNPSTGHGNSLRSSSAVAFCLCFRVCRMPNSSSVNSGSARARRLLRLIVLHSVTCDHGASSAKARRELLRLADPHLCDPRSPNARDPGHPILRGLATGNSGPSTRPGAPGLAQDDRLKVVRSPVPKWRGTRGGNQRFVLSWRGEISSKPLPGCAPDSTLTVVARKNKFATNRKSNLSMVFVVDRSAE